MTAISTVLSLALLPANLLLYTGLSYDDDVVENLDWLALFVSLSVVISAIVSGLFLTYKRNSKKLRKWSNVLGNVAGISLMIFSAAVANHGGGSDYKIWSHSWQLYLSVALPCALGLVLTNIAAIMAGLNPSERVTVSVEACYQNVGIASSLALTMFSGSDLNAAMAVPIFYAITETVILTLYCCGAWKAGWTLAPPTDSLCKILWTSYEETNNENEKSCVLNDDLDTAIETEFISPLKNFAEHGDIDADNEISSNRLGGVRGV